MSERSVILHEEISLSQSDTKSVHGGAGTDYAISNHLPYAPEEKDVVEMGGECPGGVAEQLVVGDHGETDEDAGRESDTEGGDVDVVCGVPALALSGFESQGFTF